MTQLGTSAQGLTRAPAEVLAQAAATGRLAGGIPFKLRLSACLRRSAAKLIYKVVGRILFLEGCWTKDLRFLQAVGWQS